MTRRVIFTTLGTLGDLHPYIAIAQKLKLKGGHPVIATSLAYGEKIKKLGIDFVPIRPDVPDLAKNPDYMERFMDYRKGSERVVREYVMPALKDSFDDLSKYVRADDVLVSHPLTFSTRLVAEIKNIKWVSTTLQPMAFFSAYEPPVVPSLSLFLKFNFGPKFYRMLFKAARIQVHRWEKPWHRLRSDLGLLKLKDSPLFTAQYSPLMHLALFSKYFGTPQPDWPQNTIVTGFPFFDGSDEAPMPENLAKFLDQGEPPLVFTLGSSAVWTARDFYTESVKAADKLKMRAVLLVGKDTKNVIPSLNKNMIAVDYAPYSQLFPKAAVIVHQGGVGTTGHALRSGRPMIIVPHSHDQPDNAVRISKLGVGESIARKRYSGYTASLEISSILQEQAYMRRALEVSSLVRQEDGANKAAECFLNIT